MSNYYRLEDKADLPRAHSFDHSSTKSSSYSSSYSSRNVRSMSVDEVMPFHR